MEGWYEKHLKHFNREMAKSEALPKGLQVGKIFQIHVADGYAFYEIVRINKKTVRIKWRRDLCLDEYQYYGWGEGCSVDKSLIEPLII